MADEAKQEMREVHNLREPAAVPEHCGKPMRRMSGPSSLGGLQVWWSCAKECGVQVKGEVIGGQAPRKPIEISTRGGETK